MFNYDPVTGILTWRVDRSTWVKAGDVAGSIDGNGYVNIQISGTGYKAHRLAWLWVTSEWPKAEIDHINRIKDDNRWVNLREATHSQNTINISPRNRLLPRGVKRKGRKFTAEIGKPNLYLGTFDTPEEARAAYVVAAQDLYGEFYSET